MNSDIDKLINTSKIECDLIFQEKKILLEFETTFDLYKLSHFCINKHIIICKHNELTKNIKTFNELELEKND